MKTEIQCAKIYGMQQKQLKREVHSITGLPQEKTNKQKTSQINKRSLKKSKRKSKNTGKQVTMKPQ